MYRSPEVIQKIKMLRLKRTIKYLIEHQAGTGEGIDREHRQKHRLNVQGVVIPGLVVAQQRKHHGQPGTLYIGTAKGRD